MRLYVACCLLLSLLVVNSKGYEEDTYERALRTLESFAMLKREALERRQTEPQVDTVETDEQTRGLKEKIKCREEHMACRVVPKCCGNLVCYWPDGFSLRNDGVCVECIKRNRTCQRNSQCCGDMQCDKPRFLTPDGVCQPKRTSGKCHRDSQCVNDCKKKWYEFSGVCE